MAFLFQQDILIKPYVIKSQADRKKKIKIGKKCHITCSRKLTDALKWKIHGSQNVAADSSLCMKEWNEMK